MTRSYSCQQKLAQFQKFPEIDTICNERGRQDIHANKRKKYNKKEQLPMNKKKKRSDLETNLEATEKRPGNKFSPQK